MKRSKKIAWTVVVITLLGIVAIGFRSHGFAAGGYRILQWAAVNQHTTLSKLLLACGVPPSPYKEIYEWDYNADITDTPLHSAAKLGNIELAMSLIEHHASIDWCCCSCVTPLHEAIINKRAEIVDLLLKSGADTRIPYDLSSSVIELAKSKGTPAIVHMILSHEARPSEGRRGFNDSYKASTSNK
jgi:ankyrin repeat protein